MLLLCTLIQKYEFSDSETTHVLQLVNQQIHLDGEYIELRSIAIQALQVNLLLLLSLALHFSFFRNSLQVLQSCLQSYFYNVGIVILSLLYHFFSNIVLGASVGLNQFVAGRSNQVYKPQDSIFANVLFLRNFQLNDEMRLQILLSQGQGQMPTLVSQYFIYIFHLLSILVFRLLADLLHLVLQRI